MSVALTIDCAPGTDYAKIIKKTTSWASEESFSVSSGSTVLFTSPSLVNDQERAFEVCLTASANHIYTLKLTDSRNDSWTNGAWIAVKDINDNTVFKELMTKKTEETYDFALYSPVTKGSEWKFTSTFENGWNQYNHPDNAWTSVTCGSTTQQVVGTQYFRKTFAGVSGMAAIDAQFKYKSGIVAYINGVEIFRDNMPAGEISQGTMAIGDYATSDFHGVIRSAAVAESAQSVLAVELHFVQNNPVTMDFDAFLSYGAGINATNNCFAAVTNVTATSIGVSNPSYAFDYTRTNSASITTSQLPKDIIISFIGNVYPLVSAVRIYPSSTPLTSPSSFILYGGESSGTTVWNKLMDPLFQTYNSLEWKQFDRFTEPDLYKAMKLTLTASSAATLNLFEMQFMVCNFPTPTLSYPEASYSFYARHDYLDLHSSPYGMTSCSITPQLPEGVSFDTTSCTISGIATVASPQTTYTVTATAGSKSITGTVTLTFTDCQGTLLRIVRTYRNPAEAEAFRIRDTATDALLMEVPIGHSYPGGRDQVDFFCVTVERFDVTLDCSGTLWAYNSYIYVYAVLVDQEEELLLKARYDSFQSNDSTYYMRHYTVNVMEQWYYKMGSLPSNWYDDNTSGWEQAHRETFPASTNQIQLYKKTFTVSDLNVVSGLILNIRYKYGCVVYLNGNEAFRNHLGATAIMETTTSSGSYTTLQYRTITLPGRFVTEDGSYPLSLLKQGSNTIAIGLIAVADQTSADFDASIRLMTNEPEAHIWQFTATNSGISSSASNVFDGYSGTDIYSSACTSNSLTVTLSNDRREWVNTVQIQNDHEGKIAGPASFTVSARNSPAEPWTELVKVTSLTYSMAGQRRRVYFLNRTPYNQFRFENFVSSGTSCSWKVQSLNLYATSVMMDPAPLTYPATTEIFKGIEMSELIPEGTGYYDYSVSPALPQGLSIDSSNGWISGTYGELMNPTPYTVTAHKITGGTTTASFTLSCGICIGGRSLMTVRVRADGFAHENSWKLFQGRGTTGTVLRSSPAFPVAGNYYYLDFCLNDGIYTFEGRDVYGDGWTVGTGYTLTADVGAMELEIEELAGGAAGTPRTVSTVFSTFFPFQMEYTDWKVYQGEAVPAGWNTASFDDSAWATKKAAEIPNPTTVTAYIRKSFQLTNIDDYQVLNVRMKYTGGVAVYFNGNRVARFNLIENFDANTESIAVHDSTEDSKFHIVLVTAGVQEGTNVVAFEVHRPVGTSSSDPFVFDATGVFGVETCSTVIDSFSALTSTLLSSGTLAGMMDLDPYTTGTLPATAGTFVEWTVENLEGSKWNSFNLLGSADVPTWVFELYGYMTPEDEQGRVVMVNSNEPLRQRTKPQIAVPVGLAGFRKVRYEILQMSSTTNAGALAVAYCKASGDVCPGIDFYPSVAEGQISPGPCEEGLTGYSYRTCTNGVLSEVQTDKCIYKAPTSARYRSVRYQFVKGTQSTTEKPFSRSIITHWYLDVGVKLPAGLTLNEQTGEISGIPTEVAEMVSFTVFAENPSGATAATVDIAVRMGRCNAEGVFPVTEVDQVAEYQCSTQGSYVGSQKRACKLGEKDGVWQKASGFCMSVGTIVILIVIAIIVVVVVVFLLTRAGRKTKAVGGVKGKKTTKTTTKKPTKNVKV